MHTRLISMAEKAPSGIEIGSLGSSGAELPIRLMSQRRSGSEGSTNIHGRSFDRSGSVSLAARAKCHLVDLAVAITVTSAFPVIGTSPGMSKRGTPGLQISARSDTKETAT
jgi:hypothetical protein